MTRPFSPIYIVKAFFTVVTHIGVTFGVVVGTVILGMIIAVLIVKVRLSRHLFFRKIASMYVYILRCTPSIVLLFIVFYGLPKLVLEIFGINLNFWPKIIFVVIALSLLYASSLSEIIRSAYLSVGKGQYEAAIAVGLSPFQALYRIIIPQAFSVALPNLGNSLISLVKEGSLAYTIGLIDVMGAGNLFISRNYGGYAIETYIALTVIYWGITIIIEKFFSILEKKFSKGRLNVS
ncbi:MAG: amino acid ABC transporter permease [Treponema sp.]|nr:amino acid ABC transporter permease [Treponema sp.]